MGRRNARESRERILAGAMRAFAKHGFNASVQAIAKESGTSKGLIFWYFPSKDRLILEVVKRSLPEDVIKGCLEEFEGRELLECIGKRYMEKYRDEVMRSLLIYSMGISQQYHEVEEMVKETCEDLLRKVAIKAYGDERRGIIKVRALFGSLLCYVLRRPKMGEEEYLNSLLEILASP